MVIVKKRLLRKVRRRALLGAAGSLLMVPVATAQEFKVPLGLSPFGLTNVGNYSSPSFADVDGDGDLDAFIGRQNGDTEFFANTGSSSAPAFSTPVTNPFGLTDVGAFSSPSLADIDGDGDLDAFIGRRDGTTRFFENTGTSSSAPAFSPPEYESVRAHRCGVL